ncbi:hypothetical protein CHLNCDRAFT_143011 [Chlorella variabilis]|uniref:Uncharacterized protein n=1 Tax=Chlorella variabilis TaxID=554065 RepID=E1Z9A6_CHLVA|nr:hypothetical protein CHLNCDRAFT_143011 [Chlorella variabilis]EFN57484.1 hypothetical protein CHLNCDRAFT_143011 [Chlorella variabilis]|eukprot:XP_005849586.1 hypothetical protein CHLNCDRAFT_143011 [Chlorella variabilis]
MAGFKLIAKRMAPGPTAVQSMAIWGGCLGVTALWLTQPFDYVSWTWRGVLQLIKKQLGMDKDDK